MIVFVTVILQLASPTCDFSRNRAGARFFAVTLPYVFTEATALLLLLNRTHLPLLAIPARVKESPILMWRDIGKELQEPVKRHLLSKVRKNRGGKQYRCT